MPPLQHIIFSLCLISGLLLSSACSTNTVLEDKPSSPEQQAADTFTIENNIKGDQDSESLVATDPAENDKNNEKESVDAGDKSNDIDNDGRSNTKDQCPETLAYVPVDKNGCPQERFSLIVEFKSEIFRIEELEGNPVFPVVAFMKKNPQYDIFLTGLVETAEGPYFDQRLSEKRARDASDYLVGQGVREPRITPDARMTSPMATEESPLGESQNRRLKIEFVKIFDDSMIK
ncbi:MAG: hypothetical protein HRU20_09470 [Pseudomonadales bacterium]|nr:hypothetical protein [Pseudomonadales bacterium]